MILLIRRRRLLCVVSFLLLAAAILLLSAAKPPAAAAFSAVDLNSCSSTVVILDAGHGGSDGGAVSSDGIPESGINLAITLRLRDFFNLLGVPTLLTRADERSLADTDSSSLRQEKVSDTKNRVTLINSVSRGCLISIHQNTLPGHPSVHGAQVFFAKTAGSEQCAASVQTLLNRSVNTSNEKNSKQIGADIYIMSHVDCPAILVECGFLSNPEETMLLTQPEYQTKLAVAIGCGYLEYK